ncbi:MAG: hypothetical protein WC343_03395 [Bacilli bacterium]
MPEHTSLIAGDLALWNRGRACIANDPDRLGLGATRMRLKIFDLMDEQGWVGEIRIDESQGYPDVIVSFMDEREKNDWGNT